MALTQYLRTSWLEVSPTRILPTPGPLPYAVVLEGSEQLMRKL